MIVASAGKSLPGYLGIGDDVGASPVRGKRLISKVDMLVEGTDIPPGMGYRDAARKAVAMCVSDFASKGVRPDSFLVSLGLRRGTTGTQVSEIGLGLLDAEREWNVKLVGGDTNEAKELVIDCAMFGFSDDIVERRGAKPGDLLAVTGPFGYEPAGLRILQENATADGEFKKKAVQSVLRPAPNLDAGLALSPFLTSAMDSSDGLARSLHTLAGASGVGFELDFLPEGEGVRKFARSNNLSVEGLVLEGGEEYVIVGTVKRSRLRAARGAVRRARGELMVIGRATADAGRVVLLTGGRQRDIRDRGWTHLS